MKTPFHIPRSEPFEYRVRRIMRKHGVEEALARSMAGLAYGEGRHNG